MRVHALRLISNHHGPDDLTQDVVVRAFCTAAPSSQSDATVGWLYRIAPDPAAILDAHCLASDIRAALDQLTGDRRSAVILRDIEGLSYAEIATRCPQLIRRECLSSVRLVSSDLQRLGIDSRARELPTCSLVGWQSVDGPAGGGAVG